MKGKELLKEFQQYLRFLGRSELTIRRRLRDLERFFNYTNLTPTEVLESDLIEYLATKFSTSSAIHKRQIISSFRGFYNWLAIAHNFPNNPARDLPSIKTDKGLPNPIPDELLLPVFEKGTVHEIAIMLLGANVGLRRNEIAQSHPKNRTGNTLRVFGKGNKTRVVALDETTVMTLEVLEETQGRESYYFPGRFGGHLHPSTVTKWIKRHIGHWTLRSLRHRFGTVAVERTKDLRAVQEQLGHESSSTTDIYTQVRPYRLNAIVEAASLRKSTPTEKVDSNLDELESALAVLNHLINSRRTASDAKEMT